MKKSTLGLMALLISGCGQMGQVSNPEVGHNPALEKTPAKFTWGPPAPEAPLVPSPLPQIPEQPASPMNPGDGRKAEDNLIPSTATPSSPK